MATVLVIDDDPLVLSMIEGMLGLFDNLVFTAKSFERGLDIFRDSPDVDVIIMDRNMGGNPTRPGLDGVSGFLRLVREYPWVKCILISGDLSNLPEVLSVYVQKGQLQFLAKPFGLDQLDQLIKKLTGRTTRLERPRVKISEDDELSDDTPSDPQIVWVD
jgi:DNA-binding NtrC family response regulator